MRMIFGLTAALGFGSANFLARFSCRQIGTYRTLFFMQFIGFIGLSAYLVVTGEFARLLSMSDLQAWVWAIVAALLNTMSYIALYRAFEIGLLVVVSPIVSGYAAVAVGLAALSGEILSQQHSIGVAAVLIGIVLVSTIFGQVRAEQRKVADVASSRQKRLPSGIGWALAASLGFGVTFWLLGRMVIPVLGEFAPVWLFRLIPLCLLIPFLMLTQQSLHPPQGLTIWLIVGIGLLDTSAYIVSMLGLMTGQIAVASVLTSLYSVVTVALARIFLKEQLQWNQWIGILLIFVGIALINI